MTTSTASAEQTKGQVLRAQLAIEPHPESSCALVGTGEDTTEILHHLKGDTTSRVDSDSDNDATGCECHTEVTYGEKGDEQHAYLKSAVQTKCICPTFDEHDCIPQMKAVRSGSIIVVLTVPKRETLQAIISDLRTVGASVSVEWLVTDDDPDTTTEIDVSTITDKQQEAMELAMELGYYETPRTASLSDIADELGVSESAASQRLNAAETKLVTAFLED
jgi:predicted DNA binding protein